MKLMQEKIVMLVDTGMRNHMVFERIDSEYADKSTKKERKTNVKVRKNA